MTIFDDYVEKYRQIHTKQTSFIKKREDRQYVVNKNDPIVFGDGVEFVKKVFPYVGNLIEQKQRAVTLLDYGCGQAMHTYNPSYIEYERIPEFKGNTIFTYFGGMIQSYYCYDPAVPKFSTKPSDGSLFDMVVLADVMEHVPEEYVAYVIKDAARFCKQDGLMMFTISGNLAYSHFINDDGSLGENAHITRKDQQWWVETIKQNTNDVACVVMYTNNEIFKETDGRVNCLTTAMNSTHYKIPSGLNSKKLKKI